MAVISQFVMLLAPVIIPLAVAALAVAARKLIQRATEFYLTQTTEEQRALIERLVHDAVLYAEQAGLVAAAKNEVLNKKAEALAWLNTAFRTHGISVDPAYIAGLIEVAVLAETQKGTINVGKAEAKTLTACADCPNK